MHIYIFLLLKSVKINESKSMSKSMTIERCNILFLFGEHRACLFVCLFVFLRETILA